jgi:hypothetical protein
MGKRSHTPMKGYDARWNCGLFHLTRCNQACIEIILERQSAANFAASAGLVFNRGMVLYGAVEGDVYEGNSG